MPKGPDNILPPQPTREEIAALLKACGTSSPSSPDTFPDMGKVKERLPDTPAVIKRFKEVGVKAQISDDITSCVQKNSNQQEIGIDWELFTQKMKTNFYFTVILSLMSA